MLEGFKPTVLRVFGGLVTFIDRAALSLGVSPRAENVNLASGMAGSRSGYETVAIAPRGLIRGVSQHVAQDGKTKLIILSDHLYAQGPEAGDKWMLTLLDDQVSGSSVGMRCASVFGKKYICLSNGKLGTMPMYRFDGTRASLVGAGAPGSAPVIATSLVASSGGSLLDGVHSCVVVFVNQSGDVSGWSPVGSATLSTGSGKQVDVTVPLGPPDTVKRIVAITPVNDPRNFLYTPKMVISENTTSAPIQLDISEDELLTSQLSVRRWVTSFVPWLPAGVESVRERAVVWGARATLQPGVRYDPSVSTTALQNVGIRNLAFDGGFSAGVPNGWAAATIPAGSGVGLGGVPGGASPSGSTDTPFYGKCYRIVGGDHPTFGGGPPPDTPYQGKIIQTVRSDSEYLRAKGSYTLELFYRLSPGASNLFPGKIYFTISAMAGAVSLGTILSTAFVNLPRNSYKWSTATIDFSLNLSAVPTQLTVSIFGGDGVSDRVPLGEWIDMRFAIYDAEDQQHLHTLVVSESGNPGTFVGEAGIVSVGPDDGEGVRNVFSIRDNTYIAKERSLHAISSAAGGDPVSWAVSLQDEYAGTPSLHGVAVGDGFALIASRAGLYLFDGATPRLVSDEIEPIWAESKWGEVGEAAIVVLDPSSKMVTVGLPGSNASSPSQAHRMFTLDYREGWGSSVPGGSGRKWSTLSFENDPLTPNNKFRLYAGTLALRRDGGYASLLSVSWSDNPGSRNAVAVPSDFSSPTWSFSPSAPAITTGQDDGLGDVTATTWGSVGAPLVASRSLTSITGNATVVFRCTRAPATVSCSNCPVPFTVVNNGGSPWTIVAAHFALPAGVSPGTLTITWGSAGEVKMQGLTLYRSTNPSNLGVVNLGLLVSRRAGLLSDFSGAINATYETAPFGEEVGRSTFGHCVVRARGSGVLTAQFKGVGTRLWQMNQTQLTSDPDEDFEFGADLKAPAATLVLGTSGYGSWFVVNRLAVASKPESVGWLRGRNG